VKHAIPIAIVSGSQHHNLELKTMHLQHIFVLFGVNVVCGDNYDAVMPRHRKPFPDMFLAAARMLGWDVGPNEEGSVVGEVEH